MFDFRLLMDLQVLKTPELDLTIFGKPMYVCDTNFMAVYLKN